MEIIFEFLAKWNIDLAIVFIVLLSGFFQAKYLCKLKLSGDDKYSQALKTLAVSFIVSCIYIFLQFKKGEINWAMYFISYFFATSLYELLVKPFVKWIEKIVGKDEATPTPQ